MESELETQLSNAIANMESELRKCHISECGQSLVYLQQPPDVSLLKRKEELIKCYCCLFPVTYYLL